MLEAVLAERGVVEARVLGVQEEPELPDDGAEEPRQDLERVLPGGTSSVEHLISHVISIKVDENFLHFGVSIKLIQIDMLDKLVARPRRQ